MSAAWEWRGFGPWNPSFDPKGELHQLALAMAVPPDISVMHDHDTYLLLPGVAHNLKLRRSGLEIKLFRQAAAGGFSLWEDKVIFSFPIAAEAALWTWLGLPKPSPAPVRDPADLVALLRRQAPGLCAVSVSKDRWRLDSGNGRLELARLVLEDETVWFSVCADGYEADGVAALVHRIGYGPGLRLLGYVDFLWATARPAIRHANP